MRTIAETYGNSRLSEINARALTQWHGEWSEGGTISVAHSKIGMLRRLFGFGATILEDADCTRLSLILNKLRFESPEKRTEK